MEPLPRHPLRVGAVQVEITPRPGIPLTGFIARLGPSTQVHDPLFARAIVLESGGQRAALLTCDLLALDSAYVEKTRRAIEAAAGIPAANILIACTHTHSGPATIFLQDCGEVDESYLAWLHERLVTAACMADAALQPARLGFGRGRMDQGVHNRRRPGAPIDADLDLAAFQGLDGQPIAVVINYACHAVCLDWSNRQISADYPGVLSRHVAEKTGAVTLFTNGACGDINPHPRGGFAGAEALGADLAEEALRLMASLRYQDSTTLRVCVETLDFPLNAPPGRARLLEWRQQHHAGLAQADASGDAVGVKVQHAMLTWTEKTLEAVERGAWVTSLRGEVQCIRLGELAFLGVPGELFSALGRQIKAQADPRQAIVLGYANQDLGYIPTAQAYAEGGYEVDEAYRYYGYPAALGPSAGDQLLAAAARLLAE